MPDNCEISVPSRLRELVGYWVGEGRQPQGGMGWNRSTWQTTLPEYHDILVNLPDQLDRAAVADAAKRASADTDAAVHGFIAAMVWGYGRRGYGAFRTGRVLHVNADAPRVLHEVALRVRRDGGPEAFAWLACNRLRYLGVAFATKYLYFCNGPDAPPALVLDSVVQRWLWRHASNDVSLAWRVEDYRRYVRLLTGWAGELGVTPDQIECLIFSDAVT